MNKTYIKKIFFSFFAVIGYISLFLSATLFVTLVYSVIAAILKATIPGYDELELFSDSSLFLSILSGITSLVLVTLLFRREKRSAFEELRITPISLKTTLFSFTLGVVFSLVTSFVLSLLPESITAGHQAQTMGYTQENFVLLFISLGFVSPIVEEVFFRGLIHTKLRECFRFPIAAVISAVIFGTFHGGLVQMIYGSIFGVVLAYLYEKTGSLKTSILFHIGYNLCSIIWIYISIL